MEPLLIDNLSVKVIKSKRRKTVAIKIVDQIVSILIPEKLPLPIAEAFIMKKASWIKEKLQQQSQRSANEKQFIEGEQLQFLGQNYTLKLTKASGPISISLTIDDIICQGRPQNLNFKSIRSALIKWYRSQATEYLTKRTQLLAKQARLDTGDITVKSYKARWGSCNVKGDLQYNWKLIFAPPAIIDYVIIHELCHTQHHNHSKAFWQLVEQLYPDFKTAKQWLKANGYLLTI